MDLLVAGRPPEPVLRSQHPGGAGRAQAAPPAAADAGHARQGHATGTETVYLMHFFFTSFLQ